MGDSDLTDRSRSPRTTDSVGSAERANPTDGPRSSEWESREPTSNESAADGHTDATAVDEPATTGESATAPETVLELDTVINSVVAATEVYEDVLFRTIG